MNNNSTALRLRMTICGNMTRALLGRNFRLRHGRRSKRRRQTSHFQFRRSGAGATAGSFEGTACYSDCSVLINNFVGDHGNIRGREQRVPRLRSQS